MKIPDYNPVEAISLAKPPKKPAIPLQRVCLHPSYYWLIGLLCLHLAAIVAIGIAAISGYGKLLLIVGVLVHSGLLLAQWLAQPVYQIQYSHQNWCLLPEQPTSSLAPTVSHRHTIQNWSFGSRYLLILQVEDPTGKRYFLPVLADSCQADEFRWLRVMVKITRWE